MGVSAAGGGSGGVGAPSGNLRERRRWLEEEQRGKRSSRGVGVRKNAVSVFDFEGLSKQAGSHGSDKERVHTDNVVRVCRPVGVFITVCSPSGFREKRVLRRGTTNSSSFR